MAIVFSGKEVNSSINLKIEEGIIELKKSGIIPKIITFRVGNNGADVSYEKSINNRFSKLGIEVENKIYNDDVDFEKIKSEIIEASSDSNVHGIMVFQPLAERLDFNTLRKFIEPRKDIDGSTYENIARLFDGSQYNSYCAPMAVMRLLEHYGVDLVGKRVTIIGRGHTVGKPLAILLMNASSTVTVCHSKTENLKAICKSADILISAMGRARVVNSGYVSENQVVIDVGTTFIDGKLYGDLDIDSISSIVKAYTPTPNGVGSITTTLLAENTVKSALNYLRSKWYG